MHESAGQEAQREVGAAEVRVLVVRDRLRHVAPGADHGDDGLGARFALELPHLLFDEVVRLVPGDALPLVLAALACALQGIPEAAFVVDQLGSSRQRMHRRPWLNGLFGSPSTLTSLPSSSV